MRIWVFFLFILSVSSGFDSFCFPEDPPFPFYPKSQLEEYKINDELFVSWNSHKGAYHLLDESNVHHHSRGHVSLLIYPTDLDVCQQDCAILQRIDRNGNLKTPQIYITKTQRLMVLLYGSGTGRVVSFDRTIELYTWQKVTISLLEDRVEICVAWLHRSHCVRNTQVASIYEYSNHGVWNLGGTLHRKGMPGFIKDLVLFPENSHIGRRMNDLNFINRPLKELHIDLLPMNLAETFFLCKAGEVSNIPTVTSISQDSFECASEGYRGPENQCYNDLGYIVKSSIVTRVTMETAVIMKHISPYINCTLDDPLEWVRKQLLSSRTITDIRQTLDSLTTESLSVSNMQCTTVIMAILSGCYGNPDSLFTVAALLNAGVILPKTTEMARLFTRVAAAQGSILAHLSIAASSASCPYQFAYHGVVAEKFMSDWKSATSEDLVSERTRLIHGTLGMQEGADDQVYQYLLTQANQGDAEAQANVARMMYWGQGGIERNMDQAFEMQHAAAQQNHPDAMFDTGIMLLKGQGTSKNTTKARHFLEKAAKSGHKAAPGTLGYLELNENNNITGAIHYFNQSHMLGDTDATHNLAIIQSFYHKFSSDPYYAHEMFKLAADRGHKDAALVSAEQTIQGVVNKTGNCEQALRYIKLLSSQSNHVTKLLREAVLLYQDEKYDEAALKYLVLAEAGVEVAQYNLAWLCEEFPSEMSVHVANCSLHYYSMSAYNGHGPCQAMLGRVLWEKGNYYDAARWYARAAENSVVEGYYGLGFFAKQGIPAGVVTVNGTRIYLGLRPNDTLSRDLWFTCYQQSVTDVDTLGCLVPLLWSTLSHTTLDWYLRVLLPWTFTIVTLSLLITKYSSIQRSNN